MSDNERDPTSDDTTTAMTRTMDEGAQLIRTDASTLAALNRTEVEAQLDAAHRYPRVISKFLREAETVACTSVEVAKSCMYTLKRKDKDGTNKHIVGPSIRLAEIAAMAYGNLHAGARPVDEDETTVTCQGVCWDIERNVRVVTEVKRRITTSNGRRYNDDMVIVTMNACNSIAYRNAVFRAIPRALIDKVFQAVRLTATGGKMPMEQKRVQVMEGLGRLKVPAERALLTVGRPRIEDLTLEDIEVLIGLGTRVSEGEAIDDVFDKPAEIGQGAATPPTNGNGGASVQEGKRTPMKRPDKPSATAPAATKPAADDPDAADRAAAAPTAEEIAAHEAALKADQGRKGDPGPTDNDTPPWVK